MEMVSKGVPRIVTARVSPICDKVMVIGTEYSINGALGGLNVRWREMPVSGFISTMITNNEYGDPNFTVSITAKAPELLAIASASKVPVGE